MSKVIDCRGLACPQPVIQSRKAMAEADTVTTIVDNTAARDNVSRMAAKEGFAVGVEERDDGTYLHMRRVGDPSAESMVHDDARSATEGPTVLLIASDGMGRGDDELGGILMRSLLHTLQEVEPLPDIVILLNAGVKLTVEGSPVLEDLEALEGKGVELLACGTCLGHFGLKDKVAAGEVSNMYSIAETLLGAGKVVAV